MSAPSLPAAVTDYVGIPDESREVFLSVEGRRSWPRERSMGRAPARSPIGVRRSGRGPSISGLGTRRARSANVRWADRGVPGTCAAPDE